MIQENSIRRMVLIGLVWSVGAAHCFGDIETFWKTSTCPDFGGTKMPLAFEVGVMEAVLNNDGVGGLFCRLLSTPPDAEPAVSKFLTVNNAEVVVRTGDPPGPYAVGDQWNCVVCQYAVAIKMPVDVAIVDPTLLVGSTEAVAVASVGPFGNVPALSFVGTIVLMAGLVVAAAYTMKKRRIASSD